MRFGILFQLLLLVLLGSEAIDKRPRPQNQACRKYSESSSLTDLEELEIPDHCRIGPKGRKGRKGAPGPTGDPGVDGLRGPPGPPGVDGIDGVQGPQGVPGPTGPAGPQGPKGPMGETGQIGPVGPQGLTGATGAQGQTGLPGAQGPAGSAVGAVGTGVTVYSHIFNVSPVGGDQVIPPNTAITFNTCGSCANGITFTAGTDFVKVAIAGIYKFTYLVSSSRAGMVAITVNNVTDASTIWNTGVPGITINGIGIISLPANVELRLINYMNSNDLVLQKFVNAALMLEKVG